MSAYARCPLCHGRGGYYLPKLDGGRTWAKCSQCKPTRTRQQRMTDALHRYLSGNRNAHAYSACLSAGWSRAQIAVETERYDTARKKLFDEYSS